MKPKLVINPGDKIHRLTIIREIERGKFNKIRYLCVCDCGNECVIKRDSFVCNRTGSCGCFQKEGSSKRAKINHTKHGLASHPLFNVWRGIKKRCLVKTHHAYPLYGGRGVKICDKWKDNFIEFYDWCMANGWEYGLHVDKDIIAEKLGIEPLLYSPEMCSIVTPRQNCNSRRGNVYVELDGVKKTAAQWGLIFGIHRSTISARVQKGLTGEEAVFGVGKGNKFSKNNELK